MVWTPPSAGARSLHDNARCCGMNTWIGHRIEPMPQLGVQIIKVAKRTGQEEVFTDISKWPLDLSLRLRLIGFACPWVETVMAGEIEQSPIIDNAVCVAFADDGRLHTIIKYLARNTAEGIERSDMAAEHRRQILMHGKAGLDETAMAQNHGEQPDNPRRQWLIGEDHLELGEINLGLLAGRCLKSHFETGVWGRTDVSKKICDGSVATRISAIL